MSGDLEATLQEIIDTAEEWMASEWAPKYYALCGEEKRERDLKLAFAGLGEPNCSAIAGESSTFVARVILNNDPLDLIEAPSSRRRS